MACFPCNTTENFIFSVKYRRQRVDLNTSKKLLGFVTIRHRKLHLYVEVSYTKILYLCKNTHLLKDAAFLHFHLKESSENMIFLWKGKHTKTNENMIFSTLFTNFRKTKILFFMQCTETILNWALSWWHWNSIRNKSNIFIYYISFKLTLQCRTNSKIHLNIRSFNHLIILFYVGAYCHLQLLFFNYYLAAPRSTLSRHWENTLTHPMLITVFYLFDPRVTGKLAMRLGPSAWPSI